jgi:hypothetical protein
LANLEPSGWNAATPIPLSTTAAKVSGYVGASPASATPSPPSAGPSGISQGSECRSEMCPNAGWMIEDEIVAASTSADAAA